MGKLGERCRECVLIDKHNALREGCARHPLVIEVGCAQARFPQQAHNFDVDVEHQQLFDLSDEMATKLDIEFYQDGRDALLKAMAD